MLGSSTSTIQIFFILPINRRTLPVVGFNIRNKGTTFLPIQARVEVRVILDEKDLGYVQSGFYNGKTLWNLNPQGTFYGNFSIPKECVTSKKKLELEVRVTLLDPYGRSHKLLPACYCYVRENAHKHDYWYLDPTSFDELHKDKWT